MSHSHGTESAVTTSDSSTTTTMHMSMADMSMSFFSSTFTPLYSDAWTPTNIGQYAGTCIFLIILAASLRGLIAVKSWKEQAWLDAEFNRRYVAVAGKGSKAERMSEDGDSKRMVLSENGVEEDVVVVRRKGANARPWRFSTDPVRAVMDTVIAGVSYLLMLAVMTMNVGYFLSVLGGVFLGSLALGRYASQFEH